MIPIPSNPGQRTWWNPTPSAQRRALRRAWRYGRWKHFFQAIYNLGWLMLHGRF